MSDDKALIRAKDHEIEELKRRLEETMSDEHHSRTAEETAEVS